MRNDLADVGTHSIVAHLLWRRGDLEGASEEVERVDAFLPRLTEAFWWLKAETLLLVAPVLVALGRSDEATTRLDDAKSLLADHPDAGRLPTWYDETTRDLHLSARGAHYGDDLSDAERRVLQLLASDLSLREIGRELYLSVNTVKTHVNAIYRKLGVASRAEAVRGTRSESIVAK
jgi:LuxR family maltose regulon positive regulatory protein